MGRTKKSDPAARGILESVLTPARAQDVLDHRDMIGAPMTRRAAELLVGKLAEAPDANAAADMMISRGWRGFDVSWGSLPQQRRAIAAAQPGFDDLARFYDAQSEAESRSGEGAGPLLSHLPKQPLH